MSFRGLTPESLLDRSDSKNPATTCKGLTASGRPCRRGLGSTPGSSPTTTPTKKPSINSSNDTEPEDVGVIAIDSTNAAAFFCWQHKDQAQNLIARIESQQRQQSGESQRQRTRIIPLHQRSSIDTLVERVGIIDLDGDAVDSEAGYDRAQPLARQSRHDRTENARVRNRGTLPVEWQGIQGPLMSVPEDVVNEVAPQQRTPNRRARSRSRSRTRLPQEDSRQEKPSNTIVRPRPKPKTGWSCCGMTGDEYNDDGPPPRRRERNDHRRPSRGESRSRPNGSATRPTSYGGSVASRPVPQAQMQERSAQQTRANGFTPTGYQSQQHETTQYQPYTTPTRQRPQPPTSPLTPPQTTPTTMFHPPHTQTAHLLSLIPQTLNPTTTSALLTELSKPFAKDDDAGYIYIYWLTPSSSPDNHTAESEDRPDDDIASTILDSESDSDRERPSNTSHRRQSRYASSQSHVTRRRAALTRYASTRAPSTTTTTTTTKPKLLLKIGRATNVHRRMSQWSKQCGQNITVVRYYPYPNTSTSTSPGTSTAFPTGKVPHVNKVERLIHLELRGMGMGYGYGTGTGTGTGTNTGEALGKDKDSDAKEKGRCTACGRGHREWFEVEASREGLKGVDAVVRRWVGWAEGLG